MSDILLAPRHGTTFYFVLSSPCGAHASALACVVAFATLHVDFEPDHNRLSYVTNLTADYFLLWKILHRLANLFTQRKCCTARTEAKTILKKPTVHN